VFGNYIPLKKFKNKLFKIIFIYFCIKNNFKKIKKYYFNIFLNKNYFKLQPLLYFQTHSYTLAIQTIITKPDLHDPFNQSDEFTYIGA
jgi:hypothetical protein